MAIISEIGKHMRTTNASGLKINFPGGMCFLKKINPSYSIRQNKNQIGRFGKKEV
jgi:hypothetical protein